MCSYLFSCSTTAAVKSKHLERLAGAGVRSEHRRRLRQSLVGDLVHVAQPHVVQPHVAQSLGDAPSLVVLELLWKRSGRNETI